MSIPWLPVTKPTKIPSLARLCINYVQSDKFQKDCALYKLKPKVPEPLPPKVAPLKLIISSIESTSKGRGRGRKRKRSRSNSASSSASSAKISSPRYTPRKLSKEPVSQTTPSKKQKRTQLQMLVAATEEGKSMIYKNALLSKQRKTRKPSEDILSVLSDDEIDEHIALENSFHDIGAFQDDSEKSGPENNEAKEDPQVCGRCNKSFPSLIKLVEHQEVHMKLEARNLVSRVPLPSEYRKGKLMTGDSSKVVCVNCEQTFDSSRRADMAAHWKVGCHDYCRICGKDFNKKSQELQNHVWKVHKIKYDFSKLKNDIKELSEYMKTPQYEEELKNYKETKPQNINTRKPRSEFDSSEHSSSVLSPAETVVDSIKDFILDDDQEIEEESNKSSESSEVESDSDDERIGRRHTRNSKPISNKTNENSRRTKTKVPESKENVNLKIVESISLGSTEKPSKDMTESQQTQDPLLSASSELLKQILRPKIQASTGSNGRSNLKIVESISLSTATPKETPCAEKPPKILCSESNNNLEIDNSKSTEEPPKEILKSQPAHDSTTSAEQPKDILSSNTRAPEKSNVKIVDSVSLSSTEPSKETPKSHQEQNQPVEKLPEQPKPALKLRNLASLIDQEKLKEAEKVIAQVHASEAAASVSNMINSSQPQQPLSGIVPRQLPVVINPSDPIIHNRNHLNYNAQRPPPPLLLMQNDNNNSETHGIRNFPYIFTFR